MMNELTLKFELRRAKETIVSMVNMDADRFNVNLDRLFAEKLNEDKIVEQIEATVEKTIRDVISEELSNYFRFGHGRIFIKTECHKAIDRILEAKGDFDEQ